MEKNRAALEHAQQNQGEQKLVTGDGKKAEVTVFQYRTGRYSVYAGESGGSDRNGCLYGLH